MNIPTKAIKSLFATLILVFPFTGYSQTIIPDTSALRVGIAGHAPFVIHNENDETGVSIEIWDAIVSQANWNYSSSYYNSVTEAIDALYKGDLDIVVGPASITSSRAEKVRFSQPYYQASLSILSGTNTLGIWDRIRPFFSMKLLIAVCVFLFILGCVGTLLWLAERKASPKQFPPKPSQGIANGMWCAIVTMSTTGYGDIAPITFLGRVIAGTWMVISIIFATTMVAGIASTLTLTGMGQEVISKAEQLNQKNVAVLDSSPAVDLVREFHGKIVPIKSLEEGCQLLKDKKVDAIVFDRPQMLFFLLENPDQELIVSKAEYVRQGYGFAFPLGSSLTHTVNIKLLHLAEDGEINRIIEGWIGEKR